MGRHSKKVDYSRSRDIRGLIKLKISMTQRHNTIRAPGKYHRREAIGESEKGLRDRVQTYRSMRAVWQPVKLCWIIHD